MGEHETEFELAQSHPPSAVLAENEYQIVRELARGGMGIIYEAIDVRLDREVAVKVLREEHQLKDSLVHRFTEEARVMSALQHPSIAPIYQVGRCTDGRPFHVMKLVKGSTLSSLLVDHHGQERTDAAPRRVTFATLIEIFADVCQALAYTHSRGILHLDLKPGNVMVGAFGEVHLMDWGLSRPLEAFQELDRYSVQVNGTNRSPAPNRRGQVHGTPAYMAPEQARGIQCDARSDVFGLGAVLCEILTGIPPYCGNSSSEVFSKAVNGRVARAIAALDASETDRTLSRLAQKCLSVHPNDRPRDASEVASELAAYRESRLARVEHDLQNFFDLSLDLFCIAGFDGFFRRINSNFSRVLGLTEKELLSKPFNEFVHPEDREETARVLETLRHGGSVVRFRNRYRTTDGRLATFEWTAKSILEQNVIFAVARDVSDGNFGSGESQPQ